MEITQVIEQLQAQLAETEADAQRLRTAIAALEGTVESSPAPSRARRSARGRTTRQRTSNGRTASSGRTAKVALTPDVVVKLVTPEGVPARDIRAQVNGSDNQVLKVLKDLESEGKIKRTGQRRATKWHLATANGRSAASATKPTRRTRRAKPKPEPTTA
jgi:predicted Rossmann fold nucleotide-binding protein DprA/Smf involved in DNA uptake